MNKSKTYKTSDYLKTNEDRAEYLKAVLAETDESLLMLAIREIIDSMSKDSNRHTKLSDACPL